MNHPSGYVPEESKKSHSVIGLGILMGKIQAIVVNTQVAVELQRREPSLDLGDQISGQRPSGERKLCGLPDRAGSAGDLMTEAATLIPI